MANKYLADGSNRAVNFVLSSLHRGRESSANQSANIARTNSQWRGLLSAKDTCFILSFSPL